MSPADEWKRCKPFIEAALAEGPPLETISDIEGHIERGSYQVWFGAKSCAVTEVVSFSHRKLTDIKYCGGDMEDLLTNLEPQVCAFAKFMGCDGVLAGGRKGWLRVLEPHGYRHAFTTVLKELE